ncbi:MAG: DNA polymerase III subunit gamma/tau [Armatimonadota bacterium]
MAYQSLYRKYRPQTFADVVGQGHVTRTLQNALGSGRTAHGYLFTGTRGTAKTTVARLLAKALNCQSSDAPTPEPCNACEACLSITAGSCIDVIEMDAASHRGVADIEEVRKSVGYGPMEMRYKVFIIDEAHQLSSDAKDAFLKTLEEPPANVVFILATTEPQAIPITIRSRCQQFDFKRGSLQDIATRLKYVLDCEGVTYSSEAINLVARGAEGSYRDSLSLLEQVLAFSPAHISASDVDMVLGTLDAEALAQVTEAVARKDAPTAFALAGQLLDAGKEARTLMRTLSAHFRDLLLVTVGGPAVAAELTAEEVSRLQQEQKACQFTPPMLLRAMELLNEAQGETRWNNQHRLLVELTFLKLMTLDTAGAPSAPASAFATAPIVFPAAATPMAPSPVPAPAVSPAPQEIKTVPVSAPLAAAPPPAPTPVPEKKEPPVVAAPQPMPEAEAESDKEELPVGFFSADPTDDDEDGIDEDEFGEDTETPSLFGEPVEDIPALPLPAATAAVPVPSSPIASVTIAPEPEEEPEPEEDDDAVPFFTDDDAPYADDVPIITKISASPPIAAIPMPEDDDETRLLLMGALRSELVKEPEVQSKTPPPEIEEPDDGIQLDVRQVQQVWNRFLTDAGKISKQTEVMMSKAYPTEAEGKKVTISFSERMHFERMNEPSKLQFVRKLLARCLGVENVVARFVLDENVAPAPVRARGGEKKALKRDPLAELLALDNLPEITPNPPSTGFGNGSWADSSPPAPPLVQPKPKSMYEPPAIPTDDFRTARNPEAGFGNGNSNNSSNNGSARSSGSDGDGTGGITAGYTAVNNGNSKGDAAAEARRAVALENPLVQETLQVFGGEIVDE